MARFQTRLSWRWTIPKEAKLPLGLVALIGLISWLVALTTYFTLQPVIPLFYTLPQLEQQLVAKEWIFLLPSLIALVAVLHSFIAYRLQDGFSLLLQLFTWTSVLVAGGFFLAFIRIVLLVT